MLAELDPYFAANMFHDEVHYPTEQGRIQNASYLVPEVVVMVKKDGLAGTLSLLLQCAGR